MNVHSRTTARKCHANGKLFLRFAEADELRDGAVSRVYQGHEIFKPKCPKQLMFVN